MASCQTKLSKDLQNNKMSSLSVIFAEDICAAIIVLQSFLSFVTIDESKSRNRNKAANKRKNRKKKWKDKRKNEITKKEKQQNTSPAKISTIREKS